MLNKKLGPLAIVFITVFIDLVGFGIIIPLNPYLARHFGASEIEVGLLMASYSAMQFLFSPFWGSLSDRWGRRPIILMSVFGSSISYLGFAFATELWVLFIARIFAGIFGANISVASAVITDVTGPENRSKNMGLIGAAFGLGFIFGPVLGGVLGELGQQLGAEPPWGVSFAALGASLICFLNFISAIFLLPETLDKNKAPEKRLPRFTQLVHYIATPVMGPLMIAFLMTGLAMAHMESMLFLFMKDQFGWTVTQSSYGFALVGFVIVFTQGFLIRKIIPRFGEKKVLVVGLCLGAFGIAGIGFSESIFALAVFNISLALGTGMTNPALMGTISILGSQNQQGTVLGVTQSLSALGRILGPVSGGYVYQMWQPQAPFWVGGALYFAALVIVLKQSKKIPSKGQKSKSDAPFSRVAGGGQWRSKLKPGENPWSVLADESAKREITMINSDQLDRLIKGNIPFLFIDIREGSLPVYAKALRISEDEVLKYVLSSGSPKDYPIVIVCETSIRSTRVGQSLARKGYSNVVILSTEISH